MKNVFDGSNIPKTGRRKKSCCLFFCSFLIDSCRFFAFQSKLCSVGTRFTGITNRNMKNVFDGSNISKQAGGRIVLPVFLCRFLDDSCCFFSFQSKLCSVGTRFTGITNRNMKNVFDGSNIPKTGRRKKSCCLFLCSFLDDFCCFFSFQSKLCSVGTRFAGIIKRNMEKAFDGSNIPKQAGERNRAACFCMQLSG